MDFASLVAAEAGPPEIVEFQWPPATEDQNSNQCLAYVVMKRPAGFLLCVPVGFIGQEELDQGQLPMEAEMIGPSLEIEAPAIMLGPTGEWTSPLVPERLPALVVDLPMSMAAQLLPAEIDTPGLHTFKDGDAAAFPLAAEVLRLSREWLRDGDALPQNRSGYQTAQSGQENGPKTKAQQRPKRPTVQQLATQQAKMMEIMTAVVGRLDALAAAPPPPGFDAEGPQQTKPVGAPAVLQQPLSSVLPPAQVVAKNLAKTLGPPPPARAQPFALQVQVDKEEEAAFAVPGPLQHDQPSDSSLTGAVLAQSQALVALVNQLSAGGADPLLDGQPGQSASVRGSVGRAKLQQELSLRSGTFADRVRENMERQMDPTRLMPPEAVSFMRFLERHGSFAHQHLLGLIAWQVAQSLDLLQSGSVDGARDTLSLLMVMLDQAALDVNDTTLAWLLTLQSPPPAGLFQTPPSVPGASLQTFTSLADQRWVSVSLAYLKELDTISSRKSEAKSSTAAPPRRPPKGPPALPPAPPDTEEQPLSRRQARAAQWAAANAAKKANAQPPKK